MATRIDLARLMLEQQRGREGARIDLGNVQDLNVGRAVNRDAKRDRADVVEVPGVGVGAAREALGQALLLGYGDDVEGMITGRHPEDIERERRAFADEHPIIANAAYAGGIGAGLGLPRAAQALARYGRAGQQLEDMPATPRFEPDIRQAMRAADEAAPADELAAALRDRLEVLLNPRLPADAKGLPPIGMFSAEAPPGRDIPEASPAPASISEEEALAAMSPTDLARLRAELPTPADPATAARNAQSARDMALDVTPIIGNIRSGQQALESARGAGEAFGAGNVREGLLEGALAALGVVGAVGGLPVGKWARSAAEAAPDQANVFVPFRGSDKTASRAESMRYGGATNREVWENTGAFYGPEGSLRQTLHDDRLMVDMAGAKPGDTVRLGDIAEHPQLFDRYPQYRDIPVHLSDRLTAMGTPTVRTADDGGFDLSIADAEQLRPGIAKLLQYRIAEDENFPGAIGHGRDKPVEAISRALIRTGDLQAPTSGGRDAVKAFRDKLMDERAEYGNKLNLARDRKGLLLQEQIMANRSAGNNDARIVRARANFDPLKNRNTFPYTKKPGYFQRKSGFGGMGMNDVWTLPPDGNISDKDLIEFIRNWRTYGAGSGIE